MENVELVIDISEAQIKELESVREWRTLRGYDITLKELISEAINSFLLLQWEGQD